MDDFSNKGPLGNVPDFAKQAGEKVLSRTAATFAHESAGQFLATTKKEDLVDAIEQARFMYAVQGGKALLTELVETVILKAQVALLSGKASVDLNSMYVDNGKDRAQLLWANKTKVDQALQKTYELLLDHVDVSNRAEVDRDVGTFVRAVVKLIQDAPSMSDAQAVQEYKALIATYGTSIDTVAKALVGNLDAERIADTLDAFITTASAEDIADTVFAVVGQVLSALEPYTKPGFTLPAAVAKPVNPAPKGVAPRKPKP